MLHGYENFFPGTKKLTLRCIFFYICSLAKAKTTWLDAAEEVLRAEGYGKFLHLKEIQQRIIDSGLIDSRYELVDEAMCDRNGSCEWLHAVWNPNFLPSPPSFFLLIVPLVIREVLNRYSIAKYVVYSITCD